MTATTNECGLLQNLYCLRRSTRCTSPSLTLSVVDYGQRPYAERAEKLNGRTAMLGFVAAVMSRTATGSVFFFGAFGF